MSADEMVDVLDEFGNKTGEVLSKRELHKRELWHRGAHVWIYNSRGEVLLQLRAPDKEIYPNTWDISAAGHLSAGDTPVVAALRETEEELGLTLEQSELEFIGVTRTIQKIPGAGYVHRVFDWNYIVRKELDAANLKLQVEELAEARWWPLDKFEADLHDPEKAEQFSPRPFYLYDMAITETRVALNRKQV